VCCDDKTDQEDPDIINIKESRAIFLFSSFRNGHKKYIQILKLFIPDLFI